MTTDRDEEESAMNPIDRHLVKQSPERVGGYAVASFLIVIGTLILAMATDSPILTNHWFIIPWSLWWTLMSFKLIIVSGQLEETDSRSAWLDALEVPDEEGMDR